MWLSWFILSVATTVGMAILINLYIDRVLDEITSISPDYFYIISRFFFVFFLFFILFFVVNVVHYKVLKKIDLPWNKAQGKLLPRFFFYVVTAPFLQSFVSFLTSSLPTSYQLFIAEVLDLYLIIFIFDLHKKYRWEEINKAKFRLRSVIIFFILMIIFKIVLSFIVISLFTPTRVDTSIEMQWKNIFPVIPKTSIDYLFMFLVLCVVGPILEELLFRGIIFNGLKTKFNVVVSIILSSTLFALSHEPNMVIFFVTFLTGVLLCFVYQKYKNIWYSIILHFYINLLPFLLFIATPNK